MSCIHTMTGLPVHWGGYIGQVVHLTRDSMPLPYQYKDGVPREIWGRITSVSILYEGPSEAIVRFEGGEEIVLSRGEYVRFSP